MTRFEKQVEEAGHSAPDARSYCVGIHVVRQPLVDVPKVARLKVCLPDGDSGVEAGTRMVVQLDQGPESHSHRKGQQDTVLGMARLLPLEHQDYGDENEGAEGLREQGLEILIEAIHGTCSLRVLRSQNWNVLFWDITSDLEHKACDNGTKHGSQAMPKNHEESQEDFLDRISLTSLLWLLKQLPNEYANRYSRVKMSASHTAKDQDHGEKSESSGKGIRSGHENAISE